MEISSNDCFSEVGGTMKRLLQRFEPSVAVVFEGLFYREAVQEFFDASYEEYQSNCPTRTIVRSQFLLSHDSDGNTLFSMGLGTMTGFILRMQQAGYTKVGNVIPLGRHTLSG